MYTTIINVTDHIYKFMIAFIRWLFPNYEVDDGVVVTQAIMDPDINDEATTRQVIENINIEFQGHKFNKLRKLLTNEAKYTPLGNARTLTEALKTNSVGNIPKTLDCPGEAIIKPYCSRVSYTIWVLYVTNHNPYIIQPNPTRGLISIGPDTLDMCAEAESMPDDVTHAIKIVVGTRLFDCQLSGFSIQHFVDFNWFGDNNE